MSQFPDYDARRIMNYSAVAGGLLIVVVLPTLELILDWIGFAVGGGWQKIVLIGVVAASMSFPARAGARWFVRRYPTTSATYD